MTRASRYQSGLGKLTGGRRPPLPHPPPTMDTDEHVAGSSAVTTEPTDEDTPKLRRSTRARAAKSGEISTEQAPTLKKTPAKQKGPRKGDDQHLYDDETAEDDDQAEDDGESDDDNESLHMRKTKQRRSNEKSSQRLTGEANKKSNKQQSARRSKSKKAAGELKDGHSEVGTLYDIVRNHPNALEGQISDWMADYTDDKVSAMVDLVNFLIEVCHGLIRVLILQRFS